MSDQLDRVIHALDSHVENDADSEQDETKKSTSTMLVELAEKRFTFGASTLGEAFALPKDGPKIVAMLRGSRTALRNQLAREYFRIEKKAASQQALADCLLVLEGMAQEAEPEELYLRVARQSGVIWLDLGDDTGRAVRITGEGWTVEDEAPVLF